MDYGAYLITNAASQSMQSQNVRASNMANANTIGYKAGFLWNIQRPFLTDLNKAREEQPVEESRVGVYANAWGNKLTKGELINTERDLDVAITTGGWFAIELPSGEEVYTRDGHFVVTQEGLLTTSSGHKVLGHDGAIYIPQVGLIEFAQNGEITGLLERGEELALGQLRLVNPPINELKLGEDGYFHYADNKYIRYDPNIRIISGSLETSNVKMVEELIDYLDIARRFEIQVKSLMSFDSISSKGNELVKGIR